MDTLTFIVDLVGLLAWPAAVVAVAWAARGPLLALASGRRPPSAGSSGTGDDAGAAAAKHGGSPYPDGDARADQAALLGASLAVVLTQFFGAGAWGWWSTGIGLTLLLVVLGYFRISTDPRLEWPQRIMRLLGFAAVIGLCSTVAFAYGLQTLRSGSKAPGTSERSVEAFCTNLGVAAGAKALVEIPTEKDSDTRHDVKKAAAKKAYEDCLGQYSSTHLGLVGLLGVVVAFVGGLLAWWPREPTQPSG